VSDPIDDFQDTSQGPLPKAWKIAQLGEILTQRVRKVEVESAQKYTRLGVHWYAEGPFRKDEVLGEEIQSKYPYTVEPEEFIYNRLFCWKGSFGVISEDMVGCYVSSEFPVFQVVRERADPWYLWRWFSQPSVWKNIEDRSQGSTRTSRLRFKIEDLLAIAVPLPPIPEQRAIAHVLRIMQQAREATERVIEAARELKRSLMRHLFTYGPIPVAQADKVELQETDVGLASSHWTVDDLGSFITLQRGFDLPKRERKEGPISVVSSSGISGSHTEAKVSGTGVVIGRYGSIGKVHFIEQDFWPLNTTLFVKNFGTCDYKFVYYLLQIIDYQSLNDKTSIPGVDRNHLHALKIAVPSKPEQQKIVRILTVVDNKIAAEEARRDALDDLFHTLLHHLMTAKVRVRLQ
jgi:type I restriction enzyme S subunit